MPDAMGGIGEYQASFTGSVATGGLHRTELELERLDLGAERRQLGREIADLRAVSRRQPLDPPIEALQDQLRPLEDVLHQPLGEALAPRGDLPLEVLQVQPNLAMVDLVAERRQVSPRRAAPPVPVDHRRGQDPLRDVQDELAHAHSLANQRPVDLGGRPVHLRVSITKDPTVATSAGIDNDLALPDVAVRTSEPPHLRPLSRLREIVGAREILLNLTRKEVKVKYASSVLGAAWSMLNPVLYLAVFSLVFAVVLKNQVPHFAVYLL